jgi:hypothetical protein
MKSWQTLEDTVRSIASLKWQTEALPRNLAGIDFDAVLDVSSEEQVVIEITEENNLDKLRQGIVRIAAYRTSRLNEGVLVRGYIILRSVPSRSLLDTAEHNRVRVMSANQFLDEFFRYDSYIKFRGEQAFGSAVNPITGQPDPVPYIPVSYYDEESAKSYSVFDIAEKVAEGYRVILVGDYGTGKSRCVKQLFGILTSREREYGKRVFAINLREHWGASSSSEIVAGHLEELGLSGQVDNAMQIVRNGGAILLLDGVDEVGAQVFSATRETKRSVRQAALQGVRKLIEANKGGILLTSRSHYFDSDEEMLDASGFSLAQQVLVLRCPEEFSENEAKTYLSKIGLDIDPPEWLPHKPLVFQVISNIDAKLASSILGSESGEIAFWNKFLTVISEREARIHGALKADVVREILLNLAETTRNGDSALGRITLGNIRDAYEGAIGETPDQAGEQMLMRLCTLGRVAPSSPERQFVDSYIVDGLRGTAFLRSINTWNQKIVQQRWKQPLLHLGWSILYDSLERGGRDSLFQSALANLARGQNNQAKAELISVLSAHEGTNIDFPDSTLFDCDIFSLVVGQRRISNLQIKSSYIRNLEILPEPINKLSTVTLDDCQILQLSGVTSINGLPPWIQNSEIEKYEQFSNTALREKANLSAAHTVFLVIIHKIFFQSGSGREERALMKGGFGQTFEPKLFSNVLSVLMREGIVIRHKGDDGWVYKPVRKHLGRMIRLTGQMALSEDPLWSEIGKLT